jgi:hypothetical protein
MNNISGQNFFAPQQNGRCGCNRASIVDGAAFVMAAGIMGQFFNRLGSGPFAFPQLPSLFNIGCGAPPSCGFPPCGPCVIPEPKNTWTASMTGGNTAKVDLGDGNKLEIDERSSQITIINEKTGERTRIWGKPMISGARRPSHSKTAPRSRSTLSNGAAIPTPMSQAKWSLPMARMRW